MGAAKKSNSYSAAKLKKSPRYIMAGKTHLKKQESEGVVGSGELSGQVVNDTNDSLR